MFIKAYRFVQALSIDVALGAVVLSTAMAKYLDVELNWAIQLSLFLCVWLFYSIDHLMDSDQLISPDVSLRHYIHFRYKEEIVYTMVMAILIGIITVFYLPIQVIIWGVSAAAFIVIYFLVVRFTRFWAKELFVALGYTAGIFLAPLAMSHDPKIADLMLLGLQVFFLAIINLLIFSYYDIELDANSGFNSMVTRFGQSNVYLLILGLILLSLIVLFLLLWSDHDSILNWSFGLMNFGLVFLILRPSLFKQHDYYRVLGDGIFFFPIGYLIYA